MEFGSTNFYPQWYPKHMFKNQEKRPLTILALRFIHYSWNFLQNSVLP
jgi:hypothetical protein